MREVLWNHLESGKEYYIEDPNPIILSNSEGIPYSYKKVGKFVRIKYNDKTPFAQFVNLHAPTRKTEGPYLPSGLGTSTENEYSTLNTRFYDTAETIQAEQQIARKIDEITKTGYGTTDGIDYIGRFLHGGKKMRRTKKRKGNKKRKTNKHR